MKIIILLKLRRILEVNVQHSIRARVLFPYIAYMRDDLCQIIRDYFQSFGKGCQIIRKAEFLEEVRYRDLMNLQWASHSYDDKTIAGRLSAVQAIKGALPHITHIYTIGFCQPGEAQVGVTHTCVPSMLALIGKC